MKNQNQAANQSAKNHLPTPDQKPGLLRDEIVTHRLSAEDPLKDVSSFIYVLGNIGETMEPEIPAGSRAFVTRRSDMEPCSGALVLGLLKTGHIIFGVFHTPVHEPKQGLWQIRCINPKYPPAHYLPFHFHWLLPVDHIQIMGSEGCIALFKELSYCVDDYTLDAVLEAA